MDVGETAAYCCVKRKTTMKTDLRNNISWQHKDVFCTGEEKACGVENLEKNSQIEKKQETGTGVELYLRPEAEIYLVESKY